jgi:uncharacterized protein YjiS (DUF1127 family)
MDHGIRGDGIMDGGWRISRPLARRGGSPLVVLWAVLRCWRARLRERRSLAAMDERLLRDIGITRLDRARECAKPFWRP